MHTHITHTKHDVDIPMRYLMALILIHHYRQVLVGLDLLLHNLGNSNAYVSSDTIQQLCQGRQERLEEQDYVYLSPPTNAALKIIRVESTV